VLERLVIGGYFMTEEEKDAAIGKLVQEYSQAKKNVGLFKEEARKIGMQFAQLGRCLMEFPQDFTLDGQAVEGSLSVQIRNFDSFIFRADRIMALTNDLRKAMKDIERLEPKIKGLGL
jgi:hypothetical protein